jgi:hypothetical protein
MMTSSWVQRIRLFVCLLGLIGVGGCVGTSGTGTGFPAEVRTNVSDFLADVAREALAAFLF